MIRKLSAAAAALVFVGTAGHAASINPVTMLSSFSVIALGDYTLNSDQPAPVFVGGNMTGSHSINQNGGFPDAVVGDATGALIVGGTLSGFNNNVRGSVTLGQDQGLSQPNTNQRFYTLSNGSTLNLQNGNGTAADGVDIPVEDVRQAMTGYSADLAGHANAGQITKAGDSQNPVYSVTAGTGGYAVLNMTFQKADVFFGFSTGGNRAWNTGGATAIVNVSGTGTLDLNTGGANVNDFAGSQNVIFNFWEASTVNVYNTFGASIFAPTADVNAFGGNANAFIVGNNVVQNTEIRKPFSGVLPDPTPDPGVVPLPAAGWLLLAGIAGLGAMGRRRAG